ncbi:oxidoreductase C-terminal domain-containing protein [Bradyrhizobium sp. RDT10]
MRVISGDHNPDGPDDTLQIAGLFRRENVHVARNLGAKGQFFFYLDADGRLVAAFGFGRLGAIAQEMRFAELMIGRRLAPKADALADPGVSMKSLLV